MTSLWRHSQALNVAKSPAKSLHNEQPLFIIRSDVDGDVAAFNAYEWCHSDVIVIKLAAFIQNEIPYKTYISDFFLYLEN